MWVLDNTTPMAAERGWVRDKNGAEVWLVAVKGTFDILPDGSTVLSEEQEKVALASEFAGDPQCSSLLFDTDLPHKKLGTDVLVRGHVYAPTGNPATRVSAGISVGPINKILQVTGDRIWQSSTGTVSASDPEPFDKIPIAYERAYGGMDLTSEDPMKHDWDKRNPAGCGFALKERNLLGKPVPNFEDRNALINRAPRKTAPVGFGPIAGHWLPRVNLAGTYDEHWEKTRQPLLAEDFDERYYQCAPVDQQVPGYLKGGEDVNLVNLSQNGRITFRLPRLSLGFTTHFDDGTTQEHRGVLHTVTLMPDFPKFTMVWHTDLECHHKVLKLNSTAIRIKERMFVSDRGNQRRSEAS